MRCLDEDMCLYYQVLQIHPSAPHVITLNLDHKCDSPVLSLFGSDPVSRGARSDEASDEDLARARWSESSCGLYGVTTCRGR